MNFKKAFSALTLAFALTVSLFSASVAHAAGGPFGLGLILGEPVALTVKYDASEQTAYDAGLAFNFDKWVLLYGDYHYKFSNLLRSGDSTLVPYMGIGAVVVFSNKSEIETRGFRYFDSSSSGRFALGARIPFGIEWRPATLPLGFFAEVVPGITVIPATTAFVQGGLGLRFFF